MNNTANKAKTPEKKAEEVKNETTNVAPAAQASAPATTQAPEVPTTQAPEVSTTQAPEVPTTQAPATAPTKNAVVTAPKAKEEKPQNAVMDLLLVIPYILLCVFIGIKFLCFDMWVNAVNQSKYNKDRSKMKATLENSDQSELALYEKTHTAKKVKVYNYSKGTLAKYEKMKVELQRQLQTNGAYRSKKPNYYQYTVRDIKNGGKIFSDVMPGYSILEVNSFLVNEGYEVYSIKTSELINFMNQESSFLGGGKIKNKDLVFWLTQLATYIKAGINLNEGVKILTLQMTKQDKKKQRIFRSISYELALGTSFSDALTKQGSYFPPLLINMIKAAEASGTLQETLEDMAAYYSEVEATNKEMRSALIYPIVITTFAVGVTTFIIIYVVPQFTKIYEQSNLEITGATKLIVDLSAFLQDYLVLLIFVIVAVIITLIMCYKKVKAFRVPCQIAFMHMPVIKNIIIYKEMNIFAKTFSSLLRNNVYITESMDILSKLSSNEIYKSIMFRTVDNIVKGEKISEAFKDHWAVPDVAYFMITTGESTGQLAEMMQKVSDYYQESHKATVQAMKSLIEPIMIVFLAVMVGGIIIAVIVPMFQMYNGIM